MNAVALETAQAATVARRVPARGWPLRLAFQGYPLLWLVGLGTLAWPLAGGTAAFGLFARARPAPRVPRAFLLWLAFLLWMGASVLAVRGPDRAVAFTYRGCLYLTATALFLWVFNTPRRSLSDERVIRILAWLWVAVAVGGVIATVAPTLEFTTPVERVLPAAARNVRLIANLVHVQFATVSRILGFEVGRPEAPFPFTNAWGSNYALLFPIVIASWRGTASPTWRIVTASLGVLSFPAVILSMNRGMWVGVLAGAGYAAVRFALRGRIRTLLLFVVALTAVAATLATTSLGAVAEQRTERGHSDEGRLGLYTQALELSVRSPLLGWGTPQPNRQEEGGPSVGTHGQLWLVLVSNGIPAVLLYLAWWFAVFHRSRHWRTPLGIWCHVVLLVHFVQLPIYEQLPSQLHITMVVAALAMRATDRHPEASGATVEVAA